MIVEVEIYMPNSIQSPSIIYTSRNKWTQRKCHFEPKDKAFDTNLTYCSGLRKNFKEFFHICLQSAFNKFAMAKYNQYMNDCNSYILQIYQ